MTSCEPDNEDNNINRRDDYLGIWDCVENSGISAPQFYVVDIISGTASSEIIINGLYNISNTLVKAEIDELKISIPAQVSENISFSGSGLANAHVDQINLSFIANDGRGDDVIKAVLMQ